MKFLQKGILQIAGVLILLVPGKVIADTIYVWSDDATGTIQKFSPNELGGIVSNNLAVPFSGYNGPVGLALDNVGNLYAGSPGSGEMARFAPDGTVFPREYHADSVSGLAFDSGGKLFATVPNYSGLTETAYSPTLGYYYGLLQKYTSANLSYPAGVVFDDTNGIYVSNVSTHTVEKFAHDFTDLGAFAGGTNTATGINGPWGMAFDAGENLHVANSGNDKIIKIRPGGTRSVAGTSVNGLSSPRGLAFDSDGNLYVANHNGGNILKLSTNGAWSVFVSGLTNPTSIAIYPGLKVWSAVPLKLNNPTMLSGGAFQFDFTASAGLSFNALISTNLSQNRVATNPVAETSPGFYQFTDSQATNHPQNFYRVRSP